MAKRRATKQRGVLNLTARSETRKGFTMPTLKKVKSALRLRSKTFLISLIISMLSKLSKTQKISVLIRIDRKSIGRRIKRKRKATRRKTAKRTTKRKTRRKSSKRKTSKRRTRVR